LQEKLENDLFEKFPQLFQDKDLPDTKTRICDGCACGDGWYQIIHDMCQEIMDNDPPEGFRFFQIKEKWGRLTVYIEVFDQDGDYNIDKFYNIVSKYEKMSKDVCENCGSLDVKTQGPGWLKTLCKVCRANSERL
jgi:hypothetical protein